MDFATVMIAFALGGLAVAIGWLFYLRAQEVERLANLQPQPDPVIAWREVNEQVSQLWQENAAMLLRVRDTIKQGVE